MKHWVKVHIKDKNKDVELLAKSFTNYLYGYGPIQDICRKYGIQARSVYGKSYCRLINALFIQKLYPNK